MQLSYGCFDKLLSLFGDLKKNPNQISMKYFIGFTNVLIIIFLFSCAGTKKFDFNSAYRFSTYKYQKTSGEQGAQSDSITTEPEFLASFKPDAPVLESQTKISILEEEIYQKMKVTSFEAEKMEIKDLRQKFDALDKSDKREFRNEIRSELKQLKKDVKRSNDTMDTQRLNQLSDLTRWSIIIGSVGLLLLILGAIFTGFLTFIGAILVVGAAVLFIIDQA